MLKAQDIVILLKILAGTMLPKESPHELFLQNQLIKCSKKEDIEQFRNILSILKTAKLHKERDDSAPSIHRLAAHLCMSASEVHAGIKRLNQSGLLGIDSRNHTFAAHDESVMELLIRRRMFQPIKTACEEFLISAVKYFFPGELGEYNRGIVTSYAAPVFEKHIVLSNDSVPIWPYAEGSQLGVALEPLYPSVPKSIMQYPDPIFHDLLALIDAIRSGRARERNMAVKLLKEKLNNER